MKKLLRIIANLFKEKEPTSFSPKYIVSITDGMDKICDSYVPSYNNDLVIGYTLLTMAYGDSTVREIFSRVALALQERPELINTHNLNKLFYTIEKDNSIKTKMGYKFLTNIYAYKR